MSFEIMDFEKEVINRSHEIPVLVDFWAEWCAPCRILSPVLKGLAGKSSGKWALAKVNTEEHPDAAEKYSVRSIPNVKLFFRGEVVAEFVGALPEYVIKQWLNENVPSRHQKAIEQAKAHIEGKKASEAQKQLERILSDEPDNQEVKVLLAKTLLFTDPERAMSLIKSIDDPKHLELSEAFSTILRLLALKKNSEELEDSPTKEKYLDAISSFRSQNFEEALEKFIDVIRTDRYYNDDGAREACVAIFKYLGEEDPLTQKYRREFSSALYV